MTRAPYYYDGVDVRSADYYETQYWHIEEFRDLEHKIVEYLRTMRIGSSLSLARYDGQKLAWIICIVCHLIDRQILHHQPVEYTFSDDYTLLHRIPPPLMIERDWRGCIIPPSH